ncbi:winged helix-turn-helix transcriptional regulator [Aquimarina macrocephali]|uniref:winged helix-turn-helix transcriptional regulator n=1 Tax=Aquimarina macrocephali TaxID=666563 RepID=UPI0004B80A66|nr:winged helix-turn-helix transcriptional regulator [Aquimarina macrocephali]
MITNTDKQQVRLKKKIEKYFISTAPYLKEGFCPTKNLLATTLDKWSLLCVFNLGYYEVLRFNELKKNIDGISSRMLAVTLKKLEGYDIVERKVYPEIPPKVEYSLTKFGFELSDKIIDLSNWFMDNSKSLR